MVLAPADRWCAYNTRAEHSSKPRKKSTVLGKNYRRDLKRARLTNLKEETGNKRHPSMMEFCSLWLNLFGDLLHFSSSFYDPNARSRPRISSCANRSRSTRSAKSSPDGPPIQPAWLFCGSVAGSIGEAH